jgi:hypothetical protein
MESNTRGQALIYHGRPEAPGFDKSRTMAPGLKHDDEPQDFEVALLPGSLRALCLDPASGPGEIVIGHFELHDAAWRVVALPAFPCARGRGGIALLMGPRPALVIALLLRRNPVEGQNVNITQY